MLHEVNTDEIRGTHAELCEALAELTVEARAQRRLVDKWHTRAGKLEHESLRLAELLAETEKVLGRVSAELLEAKASRDGFDEHLGEVMIAADALAEVTYRKRRNGFEICTHHDVVQVLKDAALVVAMKPTKRGSR